MNNGRRFFEKSFLHSKIIFKSFNTKLNSFQKISNCINNQFHSIMISFVMKACSSNSILKQLKCAASNNVARSDSSKVAELSTKETIMQIFSVFKSTMTFLSWRYILIGK